MKSQKVRRNELDGLGGVVSAVKRSGDVFTAQVTFSDREPMLQAAVELRALGWGVSVDGKKLRCLVRVR